MRAGPNDGLKLKKKMKPATIQISRSARARRIDERVSITTARSARAGASRTNAAVIASERRGKLAARRKALSSARRSARYPPTSPTRIDAIWMAAHWTD